MIIAHSQASRPGMQKNGCERERCQELHMEGLCVASVLPWLKCQRKLEPRQLLCRVRKIRQERNRICIHPIIQRGRNHRNSEISGKGVYLLLRRRHSPQIQRTRLRRISVYSLPLYLGTQRTVGGRPLMLKCLPSKCEHCSSRKSLRPRGHGSVLQERNFILRPTQNLPPFLGLQEDTRSREHCT